MKQSVERKTGELYNMFNDELKKVKIVFDKRKTNPPLAEGQPRHAGAALWAKMLLVRIEEDMKVLEQAHYLVPTGQAEDARANYAQLVSVLEEYMRKMYNDWEESMKHACPHGSVEEWNERLKDRPLMIKAMVEGGKGKQRATGHLEVKFDTKIITLTLITLTRIT
jgi:hypothetical protein